MSDQTHIYLESVGDMKLDRVTKLLAGISGGVYKAVGSALKRAGQRGQTVGMKFAAKHYAIGENELKRNTRNINMVMKDGKTSVEVTFGYRGNLIPLIRYDTTVSKDGIVSARVLRSNAREEVDHVFAANMGHHKGIFERVGTDRFPVRELYGPSAVHALMDSTTLPGSDFGESDLEKEIYQTYETRLEHEITRILNGW